MPFSGSCLCGDVKYSCDAAEITTVICHCQDCQKQSGSAFSVNLLVPKPAFKAQGDSLKRVSSTGASGAAVQRHFCGNCGTPLYSEFEAIPALLAIKVGTLDDTSSVNPSAQLWCSSAQDWVRFDDAIACFEQNATA